MKYHEYLQQRVQKSGNNICMGLDPVLERIPLEGAPEYKIEKFYMGILEQVTRSGVIPAAVKPNIAFYEGVSIPCLLALQNIIKAYKSQGILVILDAKRGDIGNTSAAYAASAFNTFGAHAVTVAPYMGHDSIRPFQQAAGARGIYILVRTSNPSAADFQSQVLADTGQPLYMLTAGKLAEWDDGSLGAVVGATAPSELRQLLTFWLSQGKDIPCLIPGVGAQGGSLKDVLNIIKDSGSNIHLHLINSSSGINFAWEKEPKLSYGEAAAKALEALVNEQAAC